VSSFAFELRRSFVNDLSLKSLVQFPGRTGTYAAIEIAIHEMVQKDKEVQMSAILRYVRDQRAKAIQTDLQVCTFLLKIMVIIKLMFFPSFSVCLPSSSARRRSIGGRQANKRGQDQDSQRLPEGIRRIGGAQTQRKNGAIGTEEGGEEEEPTSQLMKKSQQAN
jgi:hypothetical protein